MTHALWGVFFVCIKANIYDYYNVLVKILKIVSKEIAMVTNEKITPIPKTTLDTIRKRDVCFDVIGRRKKW